MNEIATILHGAPEPKAELSYYSPILIQCTLPPLRPQDALLGEEERQCRPCGF